MIFDDRIERVGLDWADRVPVNQDVFDSVFIVCKDGKLLNSFVSNPDLSTGINRTSRTCSSSNDRIALSCGGAADKSTDNKE